MKIVTILSGAGVSAESGLSTFRDSGGLWENYRIEDVATPEAWKRNRSNVLNFYNLRRKQVLDAKPNAAHLALALLQEKFHVQIITQNIDDLHERAGSKNVLHLHGEIRKARSTADPSKVVSINGWELKEGDSDDNHHQLRPHIVWFGEEVPELVNAAEMISDTDIFMVIGTSLMVYPAASLVDYCPMKAEKILINLETPERMPGFIILNEKAGTAVPKVVKELLEREG